MNVIQFWAHPNKIAYRFFTSVCLALCINYSVVAVELPAAATPGGALPKLNDKITEPFVYPATTLSPDPAEEAPLEDINAPRMQVRGFRVNGVKPHQALGINLASIEALVLTKALELVAGKTPQGFTASMFDAINVDIGSY